jgi:hypothetical protein
MPISEDGGLINSPDVADADDIPPGSLGGYDTSELAPCGLLAPTAPTIEFPEVFVKVTPLLIETKKSSRATYSVLRVTNSRPGLVKIKRLEFNFLTETIIFH